jgi:uncharacterized protein
MDDDPSCVLNVGDPTDKTTFPQYAHWGFWGTIIWSVLILAVFSALQVLTLVAVVIVSSGPLSESEFSQKIASAANNGNILSLTIVLTSVVCSGLLAGAVMLKKGSVLHEYFAIQSVSLKTMLKWIGLLAGILVISDLITEALDHRIMPDFMFTAYATADPVFGFWFAMIVAAPLFEEALFRGFLFKGLELSFVGPIGAVVVTAGLWATIHVQYDAFGMAIIFCLGLLLGAARVFTESIVAPLGLHAITNLAATIQAALHS